MVKVSVIMTVYNDQSFVKESVESVLSQSLDNFELIVVDDGSTDRTPEVLKEFNDSRIHIHSPGRLGRAKALNFAIHLSTGEYIAILDSDDISLPTRLKRQAEYLDYHPEVGVVGASKRALIDRNSKIIKFEEMGAIEHEQIAEQMKSHNPIFHSSTMFRRSMYDAVGGYYLGTDGYEDYDFFMRTSKMTRLHNMNDILVYKRIHANQFFFGEHGLHDYAKLKRIAKVHFRKRKYLGTGKKYIIWGLKAYLKAFFLYIKLLLFSR